MKSAYLFVACGSRLKKDRRVFREFLEKIGKDCPCRLVRGAFLEFAKPTVSEAISGCLREKVKEIFIVPVTVFPRQYAADHIPQCIQKAREKNPDVDFHYAGLPEKAYQE